jgi:hypothetical protein
LRRADDWVRQCIARHRDKRGRALEDICACSVDRLAGDVRSLGLDGWFWTTAATCLLAELLFAARSGGTFRDMRAPADREAKVAFDAMLILRNATFHPAHSSRVAGAGEPHVARLVDHLRGNGEGELGDALAQSWAMLADRPIAVFAVRMLDAAARGHPDTRHLFG